MPTGLENLVVYFTYSVTLLRELRRCDLSKAAFFLAKEGQISVVCELPKDVPAIAPFARKAAEPHVRAFIVDAAGTEYECRFRPGQVNGRFLELLLSPVNVGDLDLTTASDGKSLPQVRSVAIYIATGSLRIVNGKAWRNSRPLRRRTDRSHVA